MFVINLEFVIFTLFLLLFYCTVLHKNIKKCFKYGNTGTKVLASLLQKLNNIDKEIQRLSKIGFMLY